MIWRVTVIDSGFQGLPLPPSGPQDQLHRSGFVRQPSLRIHLRLAGERSSLFRDQDGEGGVAGEVLFRVTNVTLRRHTCDVTLL